MKNIVLFGAGFYGETAYYKLKKIYDILFYVDNDKNKSGSKLHGIEIIDLQRLKKIYEKDSMDVVISSRYFSAIGEQLHGIGISEYYIMVESLLYHKNQESGIVPCDTGELQPYKKRIAKETVG